MNDGVPEGPSYTSADDRGTGSDTFDDRFNAVYDQPGSGPATSPGLCCNRCQKVTVYERCASETTAFGEAPICADCLAKRNRDEAMVAAPPLRGVVPKPAA